LSISIGAGSMQGALCDMLAGWSDHTARPSKSEPIEITDESLDASKCPYLLGEEGRFGDSAFEVNLAGSYLGVDQEADRTTIHIRSPNPLPLLLPYLLSKRPEAELAISHACGVKIGPSGVLIAGGGGSGRTTVASKMLASGHTLVSDDAILLASDGSMVSTGPSLALASEITPRGVLRDSIGAAHLGGMLSPGAALKRHLNRLFASSLPFYPVNGVYGRYSRRGLCYKLNRLLSVRRIVDVRNVWGPRAWAPEAVLDKAYFLLPSSSRNLFEEIDPEEMCSLIRLCNQAEMRPFRELVHMISSFDPERARDLYAYIEKEPRIIQKSLAGADCYLVEGPRRSMCQKIARVLRGEEGGSGR